MWQLGIIIEISSRKELLGPIWSLPGGLGSILLPACPLQLPCLGDGILCSDRHGSSDLILRLVSVQPSAWSFYFTCC